MKESDGSEFQGRTIYHFKLDDNQKFKHSDHCEEYWIQDIGEHDFRNIMVYGRLKRFDGSEKIYVNPNLSYVVAHLLQKLKGKAIKDIPTIEDSAIEILSKHNAGKDINSSLHLGVLRF